MEAQVIRSLLESHGIKTVLSGEALRFVYGFTLDGLAEVKIFVKSEDAKEALEIINAEKDFEQDTEQDTDQDPELT